MPRFLPRSRSLLGLAWLLPALLGATLLACPALAQQSMPQSSGLPSSFTAAQREEVVRIMREALVRDPTILRDAVLAMRDAETQEQQASQRGALAEGAQELAHNAADPVTGNPKGDQTLVVFYDPRCPYCRRMTPTLNALLAADPGLRMVFKDLPILGPASLLESRALLAAQKQGGYFKLQTALMAAPPDATIESVRAVAQRIGLDWDRLARDMDDPAIHARLDANIALAQRLNIQGTPAMVVGNTIIPGAVELPDLQAAVAAARRG